MLDKNGHSQVLSALVTMATAWAPQVGLYSPDWRRGSKLNGGGLKQWLVSSEWLKAPRGFGGGIGCVDGGGIVEATRAGGMSLHPARMLKWTNPSLAATTSVSAQPAGSKPNWRQRKTSTCLTWLARLVPIMMLTVSLFAGHLVRSAQAFWSEVWHTAPPRGCPVWNHTPTAEHKDPPESLSCPLQPSDGLRPLSLGAN